MTITIHQIETSTFFFFLFFTNRRNYLVRTSCTGAAIVRVNTSLINTKISRIVIIYENNNMERSNTVHRRR